MRRLRTAALLLGLVPINTGCAGLVLEPTDTAGVTATKVIFRTLLGVSTLGLSEIWYASRRELDSLLGHHINEAIAQWGPPTQVNEGPDGLSFFTWDSESSYPVPGQVWINCNSGSCTSTGSPSESTMRFHVMLTVDSAGTIVAHSRQ